MNFWNYLIISCCAFKLEILDGVEAHPTRVLLIFNTQFKCITAYFILQSAQADYPSRRLTRLCRHGFNGTSDFRLCRRGFNGCLILRLILRNPVFFRISRYNRIFSQKPGFFA